MIGTTLPANKLLETEQALIPEGVKKSLESKALLYILLDLENIIKNHKLESNITTVNKLTND